MLGGPAINAHYIFGMICYALNLAIKLFEHQNENSTLLFIKEIGILLECLDKLFPEQTYKLNVDGNDVKPTLNKFFDKVSNIINNLEGD